MNKEISNPKQPITPNIKDFNDHDILQDTLDSLKHLGTLVGTLATEVSNQTLLNTIEQVEKKIKQLSRNAYNKMFELGWYTLYEETKENVNNTYQQFKTYQDEQLNN